jgi:hypothetical protein
MVCNIDIRAYTGSSKNVPMSSGFCCAHVALHWSAHSRGYKLSREGADPKSLWWRISLSSWSMRCVIK